MLRLVRLGLTTEQMASEMGISANTVSLYLHVACRKLGCHDRRAALRYAEERNLLD